MQKTIQTLILAIILFGITACSKTNTNVGADDGSKPKPKPETVGAQTYDTQTYETQTYDTLGVPSGGYIMDKEHGYVTFSYLHKGLSHPVLRFKDVDASLNLDADHPENSQIDVTITAANIDSGVAKFDTHLNGADFFNTVAHPKITFTSTSFLRDGAKSGKMVGELTMMGVTQPISFDVSLVGTATGKQPVIGVEGRANLLRSDFGLGKYVPYVGDEVSIAVSAEFKKAGK